MTEKEIKSVDVVGSDIFFKVSFIITFIKPRWKTGWPLLGGISDGKVNVNSANWIITVGYNLQMKCMIILASVFALFVFSFNVSESGWCRENLISALVVWLLITGYFRIMILWRFRKFIKKCAENSPQIRYKATASDPS